MRTCSGLLSRKDVRPQFTTIHVERDQIRSDDGDDDGVGGRRPVLFETGQEEGNRIRVAFFLPCAKPIPAPQMEDFEHSHAV